MPTTGGLPKALYSGKAIGCTAIQIFTASPRQWRQPPLQQAVRDAFVKGQQETGISMVVSHAAYLINLAAPDEKVWTQSYEAFLGELQRCAQLGVPYAVLHMGSHLGQGEEAGLKRLIEAFRRLVKEMPDGVGIAMETMAGQGSALCSRFEHFARILEAVPDERLVICADTCHLFAAGYELRTPAGYEATFREFDRLVGLERLKVWHLNDSKKPLGSRVDRHEHIGHGELGVEAFRLLMNDPRFAHLPMLLETPETERFEDDLNCLRGLITGEK